MVKEYKAVRLAEIVKEPSLWKSIRGGEAYEREFAENVTQGLNEMAKSGWEFAGTFLVPEIVMMAVFSRETTKPDA